jgi:hypothetical protein
LQELKKVVLVYGQVQVEATEQGLIVKPSLTHIPMTKGSAMSYALTVAGSRITWSQVVPKKLWIVQVVHA